jgi:hypothetical protein
MYPSHLIPSNINNNNNNNKNLDNQNQNVKSDTDIQRQLILNKQNQILIAELKKENQQLKQENEKNKNIINNYNKKFEKIENEIEIKITDAINKINNEKEKNNEQMKNIINNAMKQYQTQNEEKLNSIIKNIPEKMEKDLSQKVEKLEKLYYNKNENNNEIHVGIKCQKCLMNPIIGIRYKCLYCKDYNLCEKCERKNCKTKEHPHIFLKYIQKEEQIKLNEEEEENKIESNKNNNIKKGIKEYNYNLNKTFNNINKKEETEINRDINNNNNLIKNPNIILYSYQCLTKDLYFSVYKGTKEVRFDLFLKNNGKTSWPKNKTFLVSNSYLSDIDLDSKMLEPLNPGEECISKIYFRNLTNLTAGKYKIYLDFNVDNKNYGQKIIINFEILEIKINPIIANFRGKYGIDENTFSDEVIKNALDKYNNDFPKAFESLYQD